MAIQLSRKPFGEHSLITIGDETSYLSFIPEAAGYVHQVRLAGRDLFAQAQDAAALARNKYSFSLAILPFPNRLAEGRYDWAGETYRFAINDPDTGTAIHGFGIATAFRLTSVQLGQHRAEATLRYLTASASHPGYPFQVQFDLTFALDLRQRRFTWSLVATNLEDFAVPVGMCWHPYFVLPEGHEQWRLHMPPNQRVELVDALPTGNLMEGLSPKQALAIDTGWDHCFRLTDPAERTVELRGPSYGLSLKQLGDVPYTQLFVPPMRGCVAVEPMSCNVNAFREAPTEVTLGKGGRKMIGMEVGLV